MDNPIRYQMEMDYLTLLLLISFLNQYLLLYVFSNTVHFCVLQHSSSISGKFLDFIFSTFSFLYFTNVIDILSFVFWCWFSLLLIFLAQFVLCNMNPNYFCWVRVSNFSFCMSWGCVCGYCSWFSALIRDSSIYKCEILLVVHDFCCLFTQNLWICLGFYVAEVYPPEIVRGSSSCLAIQGSFRWSDLIGILWVFRDSNNCDRVLCCYTQLFSTSCLYIECKGKHSDISELISFWLVIVNSDQRPFQVHNSFCCFFGGGGHGDGGREWW